MKTASQTLAALEEEDLNKPSAHTLTLLQMLGQSGDDRAVPFLERALFTTASPRTRNLAAVALGLTRRMEASQPLARATEFDDERLDEIVAESLGKTGGEEALLALRSLLKSEHALVRSKACRSLARLKDKSAAPDLTLRLEDPERLVRVSAAQALAAVGATEAIRAIDALARRERLRPLARRGVRAASAQLKADRE